MEEGGEGNGGLENEGQRLLLGGMGTKRVVPAQFRGDDDWND